MITSLYQAALARFLFFLAQFRVKSEFNLLQESESNKSLLYMLLCSALPTETR